MRVKRQQRRGDYPLSASFEPYGLYTDIVLNHHRHMCGTAKMGPESDEMSVVDTSFRVHGLKGLRVADMSVTPFAPNAHTMAPAYQIGEMCAERLVAQYGLEN
jgi:choline dehydrogenase-like flavoprotein